MATKNAYELFAEAVAEGHAAYGIRPAGWAYLGDGESGAVVADAARRLAYYWEPAPGGGRRPKLTAILHPDCNIPYEDLQSADVLIAVRLGFMPGENELYIMGQADGPGRASTGGLSPLEQKVNSSFYSSVVNVPEFRCEAAGAEIFINEGAYVQPSTGAVKKWAGGNTGLAGTSLATRMAALTSGQHQLAWVGFDLENGEPVTLANAAVSASGELPAKGEFNQDTDFAFTTTYKLLIPANLWYGMTEVAETDIYRDRDATRALRADTTSGTASPGGTASVPRSVLWGGW